MTQFGPIVPSHGPSPARIAIVAEAPGTEESEQLRPLVGPSGRELYRMLRTVGVNLNDCFKTNVFDRQPNSNNIQLYGTPTPSEASRSLVPFMGNPSLYVADEYLPQLDRLRAELIECDPNVVIALGNIACWALLGRTGITELRGNTYQSNFLGHRTVKIVPTYHPAAILRQWEWRTISIIDLEKARAESISPEVKYDNTELWLSPTLPDLVAFDAVHMSRARECAVDVETKRGQIDCISFCPRPDISLCIPFWCRDGESYWPTIDQELWAWHYVRKWMERRDLTKVMQNGLYDLQYMITHNIQPQSCTEDTMLAHHSLWSEMRKGLGFLGSIYANVPSWKSMRTWTRDEAIKRDD